VFYQLILLFAYALTKYRYYHHHHRF